MSAEDASDTELQIRFLNSTIGALIKGNEAMWERARRVESKYTEAMEAIKEALRQYDVSCVDWWPDWPDDFRTIIDDYDAELEERS